MTSSNLDLVRSIFAGWERGDFRLTDWAHPEIEYVIADGPSPGSWTGVSGMAEGFRTILSAWEKHRNEVDEYRALDDGRVLALIRLSGRGKRSGLGLRQIRAKGASVFYVRGDKVTRLVFYWDRERALADLGLSSETTTADS